MTIKAGLDLLFGETLYDHLPRIARESGDPEWLSFAALFDGLRNEWLRNGNPDGSLSVHDLDNLFICARMPSVALPNLVHMFNARVSSNDSDDTVRKKLCAAMANNRLHATVGQIKTLIADCTGVSPEILPSPEFTSGWDETSTVTDPPTQADFQGGILWSENEASAIVTIPPGTFFWSTLPQGVLVDIKNNGAYTNDQLLCVYSIVGELKDSDLQASIGYVDTVSAVRVVMTVLLRSVFVARAGDTVNGSAIVSGISTTDGIRVGDLIHGRGVVDSATVLSVDSSTQVTMSANASATLASNLLTFQLPFGTHVDPGI